MVFRATFGLRENVVYHKRRLKRLLSAYSSVEFLLQLAVGVYAVIKLILLLDDRLDALRPLQEIYVTALELMFLSPPIVLFLMRFVVRGD